MKISLYGFQDEKCRATKSNMRGRRMGNGSAVNMGRYLGVVKFAQHRNFFGFPYAAAAADIRLKY